MADTSKQNRELTQSLVELYEKQLAETAGNSTEQLRQMRTEAIERFKKLGVPSFKHEDYKYTRIDQALTVDWSLATPAHTEQSDTLWFPQLPAFRFHFNDGHYCKTTVENELPEGLVMGSMRQLANTHSELLNKHLHSLAVKSTDALAALNTALAPDGMLVYVPAGMQLSQPILIATELSGDLNRMANQRNLVVLEKGAKASILLVERSKNNEKFAFNQVSEYIVADDAQLNVCLIQDFASESVVIDAQCYTLGERSQAHQTVASFQAGVVRNNLQVDLQGEHSEMTINGMSILHAKQRVDNFTSISHQVPNCLSNQLYKNVLSGEASGAFAGRIHVWRDAQKTNAFQRNNNVLLSKEAKMNTKPQLIIDADDVKCSHGATVGQIDEEALFYMRARGLSERTARNMLMHAFCHEVILEIKDEAIREIITQLAEEKLSSESF